MSIAVESHGRRMPEQAGMAGLEFINRELREQLKHYQAENADQRALLARHGIDRDPGVGGLSLDRIRAYEMLRYWARCHLRENTAESARALSDAILEAERPQ